MTKKIRSVSHKVTVKRKLIIVSGIIAAIGGTFLGVMIAEVTRKDYRLYTGILFMPWWALDLAYYPKMPREPNSLLINN